MTRISDSGLSVAIVGATGQVGTVMREILAERSFPIRDLRLFSSARSAGTSIDFGGRAIIVEDVELPTLMADETPDSRGPEERNGKDWFAAPDGNGEVDWPAFASPRKERPAKEDRDQDANERVRYLFPVPDQTDWDVGELRYERKRSSR